MARPPSQGRGRGRKLRQRRCGQAIGAQTAPPGQIRPSRGRTGGTAPRQHQIGEGQVDRGCSTRNGDFTDTDPVRPWSSVASLAFIHDTPPSRKSSAYGVSRSTAVRESRNAAREIAQHRYSNFNRRSAEEVAAPLTSRSTSARCAMKLQIIRSPVCCGGPNPRARGHFHWQMWQHHASYSRIAG